MTRHDAGRVSTLGVPLFQTTFQAYRSGPEGTGSNDPRPSTGDGEATSHTPPLQDRTFSCCPRDGPFLDRPKEPGAGEHSSPPEPVDPGLGRFIRGLGQSPIFNC